jgi:hypothetical protein
MPISSSTLNAIQKVGAAAFAADDKLKNEVRSYAERVNMAMIKNPYSLGNDALIEAWKVVARLSKTMMGIEEELRTIHRIASDLTQDDQPTVRDTPALAAPIVKKPKAEKVDPAITTVKIKAKKATAAKPVAASTPASDTVKVSVKRRVAKNTGVVPTTATIKTAKQVKPATPHTSAKTAPKVAVKAKAKKAKAAATSMQAQALKGNSAKLMTHLQDALNTVDFTDINQSALARLAGIPVGSMGATIGRLIKAGQVVIDTKGRLKLTTPLAAAPSAIKAEAQQLATTPVGSTAQA